MDNHTDTTADEREVAEKVLSTLENPDLSFSALAERIKATWSDDALTLYAAAGRAFEADRMKRPDATNSPPA